MAKASDTSVDEEHFVSQGERLISAGKDFEPGSFERLMVFSTAEHHVRTIANLSETGGT